MYEPKENTVEFDPVLIPSHAQSRLFAAAYDLAKEVLQQPGGREMVNAGTAARKAAEVSK